MYSVALYCANYLHPDLYSASILCPVVLLHLLYVVVGSDNLLFLCKLTEGVWLRILGHLDDDYNLNQVQFRNPKSL